MLWASDLNLPSLKLKVQVMEVTYIVLQTAVVQRSMLELEQELHNERLSAQHSQLFSQIYQHWTKTVLSHPPGAIHTDAGLCSRDV